MKKELNYFILKVRLNDCIIGTQKGPPMPVKIIMLFSFVFLVLVFVNNLSGATSEKPILFGATVSLEGDYQEPSLMMQNSYKYWVDDVNKRGGLLGRKVELILYDDKSDKNLTEKFYKRLIEHDKVDFVFSPYSSPLTSVASDICEQNKKLMLAIAAAAEKPWMKGARYLFQLYAPAKRQFIGLLDVMAKNNYKTISVIYDNQSSFNRDIVKGIEEWAKVFKIRIVLKKSYQDGKKELPSLVEEIRSVNAEGLINSSYPPDSYELLRLLKKTGYRPDVLAMPIVPGHPDFEKKAGSIANYVFGPSQWEPDGRIPFPGTKKFVSGYRVFSGKMPSFHAASAFSACQLIEQAINQTKTLDNTVLRNYIAALDTVTVLGRFKVDSTGLQIGHNSLIIQWQNGKKEIVWPYKMETSQPML